MAKPLGCAVPLAAGVRWPGLALLPLKSAGHDRRMDADAAARLFAFLVSASGGAQPAVAWDQLETFELMQENEVDVSSLEHFEVEDLTEIGLASGLALHLLSRIGPHLRGESPGGGEGVATVAAGGGAAQVAALQEDPMEDMANEARRGTAVALAAAAQPAPAPAPEADSCYICGGGGHRWHDCPSSAEQVAAVTAALADEGSEELDIDALRCLCWLTRTYEPTQPLVRGTESSINDVDAALSILVENEVDVSTMEHFQDEDFDELTLSLGIKLVGLPRYAEHKSQGSITQVLELVDFLMTAGEQMIFFQFKTTTVVRSFSDSQSLLWVYLRRRESVGANQAVPGR